jgi:hypothetical protein
MNLGGQSSVADNKELGLSPNIEEGGFLSRA